MPKPSELAKVEKEERVEEAELREVERIASAEVKSLEQLKEYLDRLRFAIKAPEQAKAYVKQAGDKVVKYAEKLAKYSDKADKIIKDSERKGVDVIVNLRKQLEGKLKREREELKKQAPKDKQAIDEQYKQAIEHIDPYLQNLRVEAILAAKEEIDIEQVLEEIEQAERSILKDIKDTVAFFKKGDVVSGTSSASQAITGIDLAEQLFRRVNDLGEEVDKQLVTMLGSLEQPAPEERVAEHVEAVKAQVQ